MERIEDRARELHVLHEAVLALPDHLDELRVGDAAVAVAVENLEEHLGLLRKGL